VLTALTRLLAVRAALSIFHAAGVLHDADGRDAFPDGSRR